MGLTATLRYEGGPVERLNALVQARSRLLQQTMPKASAAVMQIALQSLRADTRVAKKRKNYKGIVVKETGWYMGFDNATRKPVIRSGPGKKAGKVAVQSRIEYATSKQKIPQRRLHVYEVTPENTRVKTYYVAAPNIKAARDYEVRASQGRIRRHGGFARNVLSLMRGKIYGKTMNDKAIGEKVADKTASLCEVTVTSTGDSEQHIKAVDHVEYATSALKGLTADVALQRAANRAKSIIENALSTKLGQKVSLNI